MKLPATGLLYTMAAFVAAALPTLDREAGSPIPSAGSETNLPESAATSAPGSDPKEGRGLWNRDFSSPEAYERSVRPNRESLRRIVGAIDPRLEGAPLGSALVERVAENEALRWERARWPVFEGVWGEGLHLCPKTPPLALVVALPDADQTPEMLAGLASGLEPDRQFARRLAEQGCEVLIPVLIDRRKAGPEALTARPAGFWSHRDLIAREAFPLGRHVLGYEIQKTLAAVDVLLAGAAPTMTNRPSVGVAGYGEGGIIAFYAGALDHRIGATLVSGYFDARHDLVSAPPSRTLFGVAREFGDAEIATLIAPRSLVIEFSLPPPPPGDAIGENTAANSGARAEAPDFTTIEAEFDRARALLKRGEAHGLVRFTLISGTEGLATGPGSDRALTAFLKSLGLTLEQPKPAGPLPEMPTRSPTPEDRQQRAFEELYRFTRTLGERIERSR